jgi:hypothetical protein
MNINYKINENGVSLIFRYILPVLSFSIFLLELRALTGANFQLLVIALAIAGWIIWLSDFGLIGLATILIEQDDIKSAWHLYLRRTLSLFASLLLLCLLSLQFSIPILVIASVCFDLFTDSLINFRMFVVRNSKHVHWLIYKKITQVLVLMILILLFSKIGILELSLVIAIPNFLILYMDLRTFRERLKDSNEKNIKYKISLNWLQNGGTTFSGLDVAIISHFRPEMLVIFALAKKFTNFLSSGSGRFLDRTLREQNIISLKKFIYVVTFLSILCSLSFPLYAKFIIPNFEYSLPHHFVFALIVCLTPLGIVTFHRNAVLLKKGKFFELVLINWISSAVYVGLIYYALKIEKSLTYFFIGYSFNLLLEAICQKVLLARVHREGQND